MMNSPSAQVSKLAFADAEFLQNFVVKPPAYFGARMIGNRRGTSIRRIHRAWLPFCRAFANPRRSAAPMSSFALAGMLRGKNYIFRPLSAALGDFLRDHFKNIL